MRKVNLPCGCVMEWNEYYQLFTINGSECDHTCARKHYTWQELQNLRCKNEK